jgi:hypothetical protein
MNQDRLIPLCLLIDLFGLRLLGSVVYFRLHLVCSHMAFSVATGHSSPNFRRWQL